VFQPGPGPGVLKVIGFNISVSTEKSAGNNKLKNKI
tara:strand:- start:720 stop:827 length:108 start_codon:yes stop_codon:yes gene_type:complete